MTQILALLLTRTQLERRGRSSAQQGDRDHAEFTTRLVQRHAMRTATNAGTGHQIIIDLLLRYLL